MKRIFTCMFVLLATITTAVASDFIEVKLESSSVSDADSITLLINRDIISHAVIKATETPERAWYRLDVYSNVEMREKTDQGLGKVLLSIECNDKNIVAKLSTGIRQGEKSVIDAFKACRIKEDLH